MEIPHEAKNCILDGKNAMKNNGKTDIQHTEKRARSHIHRMCVSFVWIAGHSLALKLQMEFMMWTKCIWGEQEVFVDILLCRVYHWNAQKEAQFMILYFIFSRWYGRAGVSVWERASRRVFSCSWLLKAAQSIRLYCAGNLNAPLANAITQCCTRTSRSIFATSMCSARCTWAHSHCVLKS